MKELDSTRNKWCCMCNASYRLSCGQNNFPRLLCKCPLETGIGCHRNEVNINGPKTKAVTKYGVVDHRKVIKPPKVWKVLQSWKGFCLTHNNFSGESHVHRQMQLMPSLGGRSNIWARRNVQMTESIKFWSERSGSSILRGAVEAHYFSNSY